MPPSLKVGDIKGTNAKGGIDKVSNKELRAAGGYIAPPTTDTVQQTTKGYRTNTQQNLDNYNQTLERIKTQALDLKAKIDAKAAQEAEAAKNTPKDTEQTVVDPYEGLDDKTKKIQEETQSRIDEIWKNHDSIKKYADQTHQSLLDSIMERYQARATRMRDSNKRLLATKNVSNIRQGRSRYAPELAQGALTDEEYQGEARLSEIEADLAIALAEAENARSTNKMEMFNSAWDRADKALKDMNTQIEDNYKRAVERDKSIREAEKAQRDAEKQDFEMKLKQAAAAAPGIVSQLGQFDTVEERTAFLQAYADRTGIDMDVLVGEVATATSDADYKSLQIQNIENQIANRNQDTAIKWHNATKSKEDEEKDSSTTSNILSGITTFNSIEDPKEIEQVKYELSQYGLFEKNPPQWFIDEYEQQAVGMGDVMATPQEVQTAWEEYRKQRGII